MLHSAMPQGERIRRAFTAPSNEGSPVEMVGVALSFVRRHYVLVIVTAALALSAAVVYLRVTPPTYTAVAQILLDSPKSAYVKQDSPLAEPVVDLTQIETQIQIIRSSAIATAIIRQMDLARDPDFIAPKLSLASIWWRIRERILPSIPRAGAPEAESVQTLIGAYLDRLEVRRAGFGNIIEVGYSSSGPARAASIANAVARAYIDDQVTAKVDSTGRAIGWLQDRLRELGDQTQAAERAVDAYKAQHNIVSSGGKPLDEQQVADLNGRLVAARAQTSAAQAQMNRFEAILRADWQKSPTVETMGAAVSDALNSSIINSLRTEYLELQRRESEWSVQFGQNHQAVVGLRTRMANIRNSIRDEIRRLGETSRNDYEVAAKRQQAMEKQLNDAVTQSRTTDLAEVGLRELEIRAKNYRGLYETFQQRYMGAVQLESFPISEARVISPALPPDSKSKPKSKLILALGAFGGIALGVAFGFLRDLMDGAIRTSKQVEAALQLPCISLVPLAPTPRARRIPLETNAVSDPRKRIAPIGKSVDSQVTVAPSSRFVETIRAIKIGIDLSPSKTDNKVIGITSALPNEGKTTIAASLARLIAHSGKSVVIVDCDLRNPSLSEKFAPNAAIGLLEVAAGARSLDEALWLDPKTNLAILPAVRRRPLLHTSEILSSESTRVLFDRLRATYDYVIVDLPPLSPLVDARATGSFTDCYVLVVEWGRTKVDVIQRALRNAPNVYENIVGVVINKTDMRAMGRYDSQSRDLYDEKHYARYGADDWT